MNGDSISRQDAIDALAEMYCKTDEEGYVWIIRGDACLRIDALPSVDAVEVVRCKDCIYGYLYFDIQNGVTDNWIECRNPEGLNRDVSIDGYCSESIRRT